MSTSGCSFAPVHVRPAAPIPQAFDTPSPPDASAARIGWEAFFQDESLRRLIVTALEYNRDIRIAAGRVEEARAAYRIQGSPLVPQVDAVAAGTRSHTPADLSFTGRAMTSSQYRSQLNAGWEIDFWGRLRNLREAARAQYLATDEAQRAVVIGLIAQVANSYLFEREYEDRIRLARNSLTTREETLRIMRRRYEVGSGSKLEMSQAQTLAAQARTALALLLQEQAINRNALALLAGRPVDVPETDTGSRGVIALAEIPVGLPADLLTQRPDIVAAEYRLRAANANIGAARAAFFPNISLTGAFGTASTELDGLFRAGSSSWNFTPVISLPLFNGGRTQAALDLAKARKVIAIADYERTVQQAFRDVSDALVLRRQLAAQIDGMETMLAALTERARLADLRYANGRSTYLEVLDAQRDLFDTEQRLAQLWRAHHASGVLLYAALGGGVGKMGTTK